MKSSGATRHKLKQVIFRHRKKKIRQALRCSPENCIHNKTLHFSDDLPPIGVCGRWAQEASPFEKWPSGAPGVCDTSHNGEAQASQCAAFQAEVDIESLKDQFQGFIQEASLAEIASEYPDVAALMWVLGDDAPGRDVDMREDWENSQGDPPPPDKFVPCQDPEPHSPVIRALKRWWEG